MSLPLGNSKDFILSLDVKFTSNGSLSVILETTERGPPFTIHYVTNTQLIAFKDREITYGVGSRTSWSTLTRDLLTDLRKGVGLSNTKAVKATKVGLRLMCDVYSMFDMFEDFERLLVKSRKCSLEFLLGFYLFSLC